VATTWRIPGHGAVGGEHGEAGVEEGHDGLTVEMHQDMVFHEDADGMFSVDAVEYVVVHDQHGHAYVFRENYHTAVPDPRGQETDLVVYESDRPQGVEHPDGSFSVIQADNSISVTVGFDSDGHHDVTVTQTESVQIGHDPHADGHDTVSLTENEYGATTSNQTEVVTEQTLPPKTGTRQPSASVPQPPGREPGRPAHAEAPQRTRHPSRSNERADRRRPRARHRRVDDFVYGLHGSVISGGDRDNIVDAAGNLLRGSGDVNTAAAGYRPGRRRDDGRRTDVGPQAAHAKRLRRSARWAGRARSRCRPGWALPARVGPGAAPGRWGVRLHVQLGGLKAVRASDDGAIGRRAGPDPHHGVAFVGHDQPGLDEPGPPAGIDLAAVDLTEPGHSANADSVREHEEASGTHFDSSAGSAYAPSGHDPGTDAAVIH
jgi:hypothetical protein